MSLSFWLFVALESGAIGIIAAAAWIVWERAR
jgi:hypothetical protein